MIRDATIEDLAALVELHINNFDKNELSQILGHRFIKAFYSLLLSEKHANILVILFEGKIVATTMVFTQLSKFESSFKYKTLLLALMYLSKNIFNIKKIIHFIKSVTSKKSTHFVPKEIYDYCVATFIIDKPYRKNSLVREEFFQGYDKNISFLKTHTNSYWGSCRVSNQGSLRILQRSGMGKVVKMESFPEDIYIAIKKEEKQT